MVRWTSCAAQVDRCTMGRSCARAFLDSSCVDPERHADTITTSSSTCTEFFGTGGEMRQFMSVNALLCHQRMKHGFRNPMFFFFLLMRMVCAVRVARTLEEGCASWTTFQFRGDRAVLQRGVPQGRRAETLLGASRGT